MEIFRHELFLKSSDHLNIYFLGDIHEGNCNHAEDELKKAVQEIENDPNALWIGMGDYIEAITISDKRFDPLGVSERYKIKDLKDLPYHQIEKVYNNLRPIDHKCLALLIGNHEETYVKYNHSDVYMRFAEMFQSKPKKIGYVGFVDLGLYRTTAHKRPDFKVTIALNHGDGGTGYREGYALNKVYDVFRWTDADICVMGHIHQLVHDRKKIVGVGDKSHLQRRWRYWGVSGCFLYTYVEGNKNYFEHKGRSEGSIGLLKATIWHENHVQKIRLSDVLFG